MTTSKRLVLFAGLLLILSRPVAAQQPVAQSGNWLVQGLVAHDAAYSGNPLPLGCYASASAPTAVSDGDVARMWCLTNGAISTNIVNATLAVTQSGTWNITNISGTISLPTGAATATNQTTANTSLSSIDGKLPALSGGRVPVDPSFPTSASTSAVAVRCVDVTGSSFEACGGSGGSGSNAAASATGSAVPADAGYTGINVSGTLRGWTGLSLGSHYAGTVAIVDGSGNQITSFGGSGGTASNFTSAFPSSGTAAGFNDGTNMQGARVFDGDSGAGSQYILGVGLRKTASGGTVEAGTSSDPLRVDPTGTTAQPVTDNSGSLTVDAPVGTPVFVRLSDGSSAITNLATNLAQVAGASVATGNGTASGAIRVALPTDGTGVVGLIAGSNLIGQVGRKNTFDSKVTLTTTTNFTSLGSGSGWSGGAITTTGCYDLRFRVKTKGSSASNTGLVDFYLASSIAGETTFDDAVSSSADQTFTASGRKNSRYIRGIATNGTSSVTGSLSALDAFPTLPGAVVPVAINNSGAALSSTAGDHVIDYECVR